jgi:hypothetical protein
MSFKQFLHDAGNTAPFLVYRKEECPEFPDAITRGLTCPENDDNNLSEWHPFISFSDDPDYFLVVPLSRRLGLPTCWLSGIISQGFEINWILVMDEDILAQFYVDNKEPLVAIWDYKNGPRPWSQRGGDEDWTAVVRMSVYSPEVDYLYLLQHLDYAGAEGVAEGDFVVYTGAHA